MLNGQTVETHARSHQPLHQLRVLQRPVAVVEALDLQEVERFPDIHGRAFFPGMGGDAEALATRRGEDFLEL